MSNCEALRAVCVCGELGVPLRICILQVTRASLNIITSFVEPLYSLTDHVTRN